IGSITPEKTSRIANSVVPSLWGVSVNVRTPRNIGANPSLHSISRAGSSLVTFGEKVRFGSKATLNESRLPSAISPSRLVRVVFHDGNRRASVRSAQIRSEGAAIRQRTAQSWLKVD